jgi:hypothetical protein
VDEVAKSTTKRVAGMSGSDPDFLRAIEREFTDKGDFINYLDESYKMGFLSGEFNVIGAVNNLPGGKQGFLSELTNEFRILNSSDDLYLLRASVDDEPVHSYIYLDDHVPVFFTTANKTDEIPPTIWKFLRQTQGVGRLMLSKRKVDEIRQNIVADHENLLIPYFSARRSEDSSISARHRENTERSLQYRAVDGLEAYREMRYNYGVLPNIMVFEQPNQFKFKIKADGTFVHQKGGIQTLWNCLEQEITRVKTMKEYANTAEYGTADSSFFGEDKFHVSTPWAIHVDDGIDSGHLDNFRMHLAESFWEFSVSEYNAYPEFTSFEAEVIDKSTNERTTMKTKGNEVRVFPRERTDIDQSLRIFNFIGDHFDSDCTPKQVV